MQDFHKFSKQDIIQIQLNLLKWYNKNKRTLPWRDLPSNVDLQNKAYRVLVSEIMLQQTQVATVISFYERWVKKWPTLQKLSQANLEEVQTAWKGLGYYSRGRRLLELAQKTNELPKTSDKLILLPGIGGYTAGAVASIAFDERVPAVDGNVTRVISRLRVVGGLPKSIHVKKVIFNLADSLVPENNPGDWNQAVMELGATVCTPRNPDCKNCPLQSSCYASQSTLHDIEDCDLCLTKDIKDPKPTDFPMKFKKVVVRDETTTVCILTRNEQYFMVKRNSKGLLADLWQFPSFLFSSKKKSNSSICNASRKNLKKYCKLRETFDVKVIGDVSHKFSHINMTYCVLKVVVADGDQPSLPPECCEDAWVSEAEFHNLPVSTAMRKVFDAFLNDQQPDNSKRKKRKIK